MLGHFWEYVLYKDHDLGYDPSSGDCVVSAAASAGAATAPPRPTKLRWDLPQSAVETFSRALEEGRKMISDMDLFVLCHDRWGKNEMKRSGVSPDAFMQIAFQLAYRRIHGRFCLTYEAAMTRLFREGRTETVRSCTLEATRFAAAMDEEGRSAAEKVSLLRLAQDAHMRQIQDAMTGRGVDRHLFCLYVVSRYLELDSPFLHRVLSEPWRLSTSQTAVRGEYIDVSVHPELSSCGGGFGPVDDEGYGVSYLFIGEERVFVHISCKKSGEISVRGGRGDLFFFFYKPAY